MPLNSNASARFEVTSDLPGASTDFVIAAWVRFGTTSGTPIIAVLNDSHYTFVNSGNLTLQSVNCGTCPTDWGYLVWRRVGSELTLSRVAAGGTSITELGVDAFFGADAITNFKLWGDSIFGSPDDIDIYDVRMWSGSSLPNDSALLIERYNYHPIFVTGLTHHWRFDSVANFGVDSLGGTETITGTPVFEAPRLAPIGDSITSGRLDIGDTPDSESMCGTSGLITATGLTGLGFTLDTTMGIPAESMAGHVTAMASTLIPKLATYPPGSIIPIFGSVNDTFDGDATDCYNAIVDLAQECQSYGMIVIGAGPTDAPAWGTEAFSAAVRALVLADSTNFVDSWDVGTHGGIYTTSGGDGIHPVSYTGLNTYFKNSLNFYLLGIEPSATTETEGFRFRFDDGSESTATWIDAQDTNIELSISSTFRLRMLTDYTGDPESHQRALYYRRTGDSLWELVMVDE